MTISSTLHQYLNRAGVPYEVTLHEPTDCALQTARVAAVPADQLAKAVLLRRSQGYLLALVPASRQVQLEQVGSCLHDTVCLATESEVANMFSDCAAGSIPPVGDAYGLHTIVDQKLGGLRDVYFEAGDHCSLVHVNGSDFDELTADLLHVPISTRH
ncbi:MAG: YbaK/EbsC family protein [Alphaproteobacteria bacterium]|nr:YbaK/EbsC family protein [Alphaproteobacteria bacterium]